MKFFSLFIISLYFIPVKCDLFKSKHMQLDGFLAAYGDFDSDKFTDLFIINSNRQSFEILKTNDKDHYSFIKQPNLTCQVSKEEEIVGLIPSDFYGSAMMDVIVITKIHSSFFSKFKISQDLFNIYLVHGTRHSLDCLNLKKQEVLFKSRVQPLLLDYNGDMIGDLLVQDENNDRYIFLFENGNFTEIKLSGNEPIRNPNSNAFIDLNNDFVPDIFIEGEIVYEYFYLKPLVNHNHINFNQNSTYRILKPDEAIVGLSTFIDYDADGKIDHVIPVCKDYGCTISSIVVLKQNKPNEFSYLKIATDFVDNLDSKKRLCFVKEFNDQQLIIPLKLRHTDVDGDGYIDLIALMTDCSRPEKEKYVYILKNVPNSKNSLERTFKVFSKLEPKYEVNERKSEVVLASFLDLGEDGNPDFLIVSKHKNKFIINTFVNEFMVDACFFKILVISGRCYEDCGKSLDNKMKNPFTNTNALGYGTNQAGQTIYFELVDSGGKKIKSCAGQLSQTADLALQMPYNIFGLGQMPNFVDLLTSSLPINYTSSNTGIIDKSNFPRIQSWTQIVPDSQVVVIPHPPNEPSRWRTKLFITPSDNVLSTFITLIVICFVLSLLIFFLWRKEVLEDRAEHKEYKKHWPESK